MAVVSRASASAQRPARTALATGPAMMSCQNRRGDSARGAAAKRLRWRPINSASSPIRAGSKASISSRRRRAKTGEAPPVPIATTTWPRSTMAGKMKVESSGRSTTLTGMRRRRARAAIWQSIASPAAETRATASLQSACSGSPTLISSRPRPGSVNSSSTTSALPANQRTCAPAARSRRSLPSAGSPAPTRIKTPAAASKNRGRKRIASTRKLT
jgi:hypothetical protein